MVDVAKPMMNEKIRKRFESEKRTAYVLSTKSQKNTAILWGGTTVYIIVSYLIKNVLENQPPSHGDEENILCEYF